MSWPVASQQQLQLPLFSNCIGPKIIYTRKSQHNLFFIYKKMSQSKNSTISTLFKGIVSRDWGYLQMMPLKKKVFEYCPVIFLILFVTVIGRFVDPADQHQHKRRPHAHVLARLLRCCTLLKIASLAEGFFSCGLTPTFKGGWNMQFQQLSDRI